MNIAVMSPHTHGNGNTTVAALISASFAQTNAKVCLTHVKSKSDSLMPYYSLQDNNQQSRSVQILNLIKTHSMPPASFPNYCRNVSDRYDIFSMDTPYSSDINEADMADVVEYMADYAPYDYVIFDVDENSIEKPAVDKVMRKCDCVVLVLSQVKTELDRFNDLQAIFTTKLVKHYRKPIIVVANKFRDSLGTVKDLAAQIGVHDTNQWYLLHDNPYVLLCENNGNLRLLSEEMKKHNGDVVELEYDVERIVNALKTVKRNNRIVSNLERQARDEKQRRGEKKAPVPTQQPGNDIPEDTNTEPESNWTVPEQSERTETRNIPTDQA